MRHINLISIISIVILIAFSSCRDDRFFIKGSGPSVSNTRTPGHFTEVSLAFSANVEIYRDSTFRVELHGQQNILNVIETRVSGSELKLCLERGTTIRKHDPITIRVYMPTISSMEISGSGNMTCISEFSSTNLTTNVSGSGDITYRGTTSNWFSANVSGSGSIRHSGTGNCYSSRCTISGSGNIYAEWLQSGIVEANISGSGDQYIHATNELNARISGSGNIHYRGKPSINVSISGSGKLIALQ